MPILTTFAVIKFLSAAVKGAVVVAKSTAIKGALAHVAPHASHFLVGKSAVDTAAILTGGAALIGTGAAVVKSIKSGEKGLEQIQKGISERDLLTTGSGGLKVIRSIFSLKGCMFDFYDISSYCQADEFLQFDNFQISEETKKDAIQYAKGKLIDSIGGYIEDQCSSGRSSGTICNDPNYKKKILMFYQCGFSKNDSYQTIIDNAGVVYNNIIQFNYKLGIHKDLSIYDHFLVYCMAGWIKENLLDYSVDNRSQKDIASDITTRIFEYLKYTHAA